MILSDNLFEKEIPSIRYENFIRKRKKRENLSMADEDEDPKEKMKRFEYPNSNAFQHERVTNIFTAIAKELISNKQTTETLKDLQTSFRSNLEDFKRLQKRQDNEIGDLILDMYINDMKLTAWQCQKLFGIGPSRYKRDSGYRSLERGDLKKYLTCRALWFRSHDEKIEKIAIPSFA